MASLALSRRHALLSAGALVVAFTASCTLPSAETAAARKPQRRPDELDSWIAVRRDNSVIGYFGKVDVGLGIHVAIAQIIADELDVDFGQVQIVMGDTALTNNQGGASGSTGVELGGLAMRAAAAKARSILVGMAATRFNTSPRDISVNSGIVTLNGKAAQKTTYGDLIGDGYFDTVLEWNGKTGNELLVQTDAPLKPHAQYRVVGRSIPRPDIADKLFGREIYVTDVRIPGMRHGRMVRPPAVGAMPLQVDTNSVAHLEGVQVVWKQGLLGVVAPKEWTAICAARELQVKWSQPAPPYPVQDSLYLHMTASPSAGQGPDKTVGNPQAAFANAATFVAAVYQWPFQSHASMGPACAIADVKPDHATIWTGDQKPHYIRDGVAALLGLPADHVHTIWHRGPGSYGRNDGGDAAMDAAILSQAAGVPVRLQYMRADATAWDPKGPASVHRVAAGLDVNNTVTAWRYHSKAFSRENIASHPDDPAQSLAGQMMGMPISPKQAFDVPEETYGFANQSAGWDIVPALAPRASPLRSSHLRDPLGPQLNFASESFIDELAYQTETDPVEFRLRYLQDKRGAKVIEAAAKAANWSSRTAPAGVAHEGVFTGTGIAFARRKNTRVAAIAEVTDDRQTGRIYPRRWFVAHDCGLIINPKNLRLVIEGNIIHATSRALFEEVMFSPAAVTSTDWISYPILQMKNKPESIDITLIDHHDDLPLGAGEPSSRPVAAAIANAVFHATGIRLRQAPFTPARMKAAFA